MSIIGEQVEGLHIEGSGEHATGDEGIGEHGRSSKRADEHSEGAGHKEGPGEGEESGQALALGDTYDQVRNGARLVMVYDPTEAAFQGAVGNTTDQTLCGVRVEAHLSNGTELGPTTPTDLAPGEMIYVKLSAAGETFDGWSAHPEISSCSGGKSSGEHGVGGERAGEHDAGGEGAREHTGETGN